MSQINIKAILDIEKIKINTNGLNSALTSASREILKLANFGEQTQKGSQLAIRAFQNYYNNILQKTPGVTSKLNELGKAFSNISGKNGEAISSSVFQRLVKFGTTAERVAQKLGRDLATGVINETEFDAKLGRLTKRISRNLKLPEVEVGVVIKESVGKGIDTYIRDLTKGLTATETDVAKDLRSRIKAQRYLVRSGVSAEQELADQRSKIRKQADRDALIGGIEARGAKENAVVIEAENQRRIKSLKIARELSGVLREQAALYEQLTSQRANSRVINESDKPILKQKAESLRTQANSLEVDARIGNVDPDKLEQQLNREKSFLTEIRNLRQLSGEENKKDYETSKRRQVAENNYNQLLKQEKANLLENLNKHIKILETEKEIAQQREVRGRSVSRSSVDVQSQLDVANKLKSSIKDKTDNSLTRDIDTIVDITNGIKLETEAVKEQISVYDTRNKVASAIKTVSDTVVRNNVKETEKLRDAYVKVNAEIAKSEELIPKINPDHEATKKAVNALTQLKKLRDQLGQRINTGGAGVPPGNNPPLTVASGGSDDPIDVKGVSRTIAEAKAHRLAADAADRHAFSLVNIGRQAGLAAKRYTAFIIGIQFTSRVSAALQRGSEDFLRFESQITKLEQVSQKTGSEIRSLSGLFIDLGRSTGVSATEIANAAQTLAQAGFTENIDSFARSISKVPLAATFGSIQETVDGLIAIFGQFNKRVSDTGHILDVVNKFAADFAVESKDIFEIVKRGGSAVSTAGVQFEEFVELGSLLRSSTRESAETIGTFFKTAFAQLLSEKSQKQLRLLGVESGKVTDQLAKLAEVLNNGNFSDIEKIQIAEKLTGERQFARLLQLLKQISDPNIKKKLEDTRKGIDNSLNLDIVKRLDDIGVSFGRIQQSIDAFFKTIGQNQSLKSTISLLADFSQVVSKLGDSLGTLSPLIITLFAKGLFGASRKFRIGLGQALGIDVLRSPGQTFKDFFKRNLNGTKNHAVDSGTEEVLTPTQILEATARRRTNRNRKIRGGLGAFSLVAPLASIAAVQLAGASETPFGKQVQDISSSAAIGAGIGSLIGPVSAFVGLLGGAAVGALQSFIDAVDNTANQVLASGLKQAQTTDDISKAVRTAQEVKSGTDIFGLGSQADFLNGIRKFEDTFTGINRPDITPSSDAQRVLQGRFGNLSSTLNDLSKPINQGIQKVVQGRIKEAIADFRKNNKINAETRTPEQLEALSQAINSQVSFSAAKLIQDKDGFAVDPEEIRLAIERNLVNGISSLSILSDKFKETIRDIDFTFFAKAVDDSFRILSDRLTDIFENSGRFADKLNNIVTDINQSLSFKAPTNQQDLFKSVGANFAVNFEEQSKNIAEKLQLALSNPDIRNNLETFATSVKNLRGGTTTAEETVGGQKTIVEFLTKAINDPKAKELGKQFFPILQQLADESGKDIEEVFKVLREGAGKSTLEIVKELRNQQPVLDKYEQSIRQTIDLFNKRIEIENKLQGNLRSLNETFVNISRTIEDTIANADERRSQQTAFINKTGAVQVAIDSAQKLSTRANKSTFTNQGQFIQGLLDSARNRATAQKTTGSLSDISKGTAILNDYLNKQSELGLRLVELDSRIGLAAKAADTLREAFTTLDNNIQSAGSAITEFNVKDLADSISALQKFKKGGLNNLNDKEFGQTQRLLSTIGELDVGGVSGNKLLGNIKSELGTNFAAAIKTIFSGGSFDDNLKATKSELESLRKQQEAAAAAESVLREQQIQLLQAQQQLIPIEQSFYKDQLAKLQDIQITLEPLQNIEKILANSLRLPIPTSILKTQQGSSPEDKKIFDDIVKQNQALLDQLRNSKGFNTGGYIGGSGSGDIVPAMLEPGEIVINKRAVKKFGAKNLLQINSGKVKGYANGGSVPVSHNNAGFNFGSYLYHLINDNRSPKLDPNGLDQDELKFNNKILKSIEEKVSKDVDYNLKATEEEKQYFKDTIAELRSIDRKSQTPLFTDTLSVLSNNIRDISNRPFPNNISQGSRNLSGLSQYIPPKEQPLVSFDVSNIQKIMDRLVTIAIDQFSSFDINNIRDTRAEKGIIPNFGKTRNDLVEELRSQRGRPLDPFDPIRYPDGRLPSYMRPNAPEPVRQPVRHRDPFDPNNYPGGRLPSYMIPNAPAPQRTPRTPINPLDPANYPDGRLPSYMRPTEVPSIKMDDGINPFNEKLNTTTTNLDKLTAGLTEYHKSIDKLVQQINSVNNVASAGGVAGTLEIAPIQVNVALSAPDILSLAGESLYKAVMAKIGPAIAESFGAVSVEARNQFESNIPKF